MSLRMIAAFDVHYQDNGLATAGAVLFPSYRSRAVAAEYACSLAGAAEYIPGRFFLRELPALLELLPRIRERIDEAVVDGYVDLGHGAGLGRHLYERLGGSIPVIGVAKSRFLGAPTAPVFRGRSRRPLYVTAAGLELEAACSRIRSMSGVSRAPELLKAVDRLARQAAAGSGEGLILME